MTPIRIESTVGDDGVLHLSVPVGAGEANRHVVVIIEPASPNGPCTPMTSADWSAVVQQTYGSCAGLGLRRHDQGEFELRDPIQ